MPHRLLSMTLAGTVALTPAGAAFAAFRDVGASTSERAAVEALQEDGILEGYGDGTFRPGATINRAEFVKIILESRARQSDGSFIDDFSGDGCFPDVRKDWYAKYVCTAKKKGIIEGNPDGLFHPERSINFVEAAKILSLAYDQAVSQFSPDWYEPYARALESGNAIPTSIEALDAPLTRGEMAEMMWRLRENMQNRPAKAYLNVKYPEMTVNLAGDVPQTPKTCTDLAAFAAEAARGGTVDYFYRDGNVRLQGMPMPAMAPTADDVANASAEKSASYADTNVQVAGVDEGDIVKTDGTHLYIIRNGEIRIVRADPDSKLAQTAVIDFDDPSFTPADLYIDGDTLAVIGSGWKDGGGPVRIMDSTSSPQMKEKMMSPSIWPGPWGSQRTTVHLYDVGDRSSPKRERTVSFEGSAISTRRIGDKLYLVVNQPVKHWGQPIPLLRDATASDVLPVIEDSAGGGEQPVAKCADVTILPRVPSPQYLTVGVIDLDSPNAEVRREVILGSADNVYASLDHLFVANTEWKYAWNGGGDTGVTTRVYRFAFDPDGIRFDAHGSVRGRVLNQFSMDEHDRSFRIATTEDGQWTDKGQTPSRNHLFVLNDRMEQVGSVEDIAPGEQIYSVRFLGDRAYMVTFKKIDPFFVIDVGDPRKPKILGKLKIPGYSDYLHPYDEDHVIGFGKEAVEAKGADAASGFAWYQGMKVALFDVSDVANPVEKHRIVIGDRGTESPLLQNHKALLFEPDRNLLAFPVRIHKISDAQKRSGDPGSAWGDPVFQGAQVYDISAANGFRLRGQITHYDAADLQKAGGYLYGKDIDRILRIGEDLVTVSMHGVQRHTEDDVEPRGALTFAEEPVAGGKCPDPNDPKVHYVSRDVGECARVDFACIENAEAFSNQCGCGCVER